MSLAKTKPEHSDGVTRRGLESPRFLIPQTTVTDLRSFLRDDDFLAHMQGVPGSSPGASTNPFSGARKVFRVFQHRHPVRAGSSWANWRANRLGGQPDDLAAARIRLNSGFGWLPGTDRTATRRLTGVERPFRSGSFVIVRYASSSSLRRASALQSIFTDDHLLPWKMIETSHKIPHSRIVPRKVWSSNRN